ncbi:peptidase [Litorimonas sp. WD9-15]|uniref:peptidase n=1 Tax=Litorimonas sp. WD9-15 TaxID=3418716 RepID=UPI003CFEC30F
MTYCVGMTLNSGIVFMSDTRTNAGVDDIASVKKMHTWTVDGDRVITIMTAGNLATTQSLISLLSERSVKPKKRDPSILKAPTMFQVARLVGDTLREVIQSNAGSGQEASSAFNATVIVGGQIKGMTPRLFLVYPEGNFIEASADNPFFQIGENKYGKPILVRAYDPEMSHKAAMKLLLVSFDSTIKANLSVGLPLDYQIYETDSFKLEKQGRIEADDPYFLQVSNGWGDALKEAFLELPEFSFD